MAECICKHVFSILEYFFPVLFFITLALEKYIIVKKEIQGDSKLLSGFPWPIIFRPETTK
jgi:hypothetical protein